MKEIRDIEFYMSQSYLRDVVHSCHDQGGGQVVSSIVPNFKNWYLELNIIDSIGILL